MRLSFDRLSGLAKEQIGYDARSGALFVFFGRRKDALKVLTHPLEYACSIHAVHDSTVREFRIAA
jgi:transposase